MSADASEIPQGKIKLKIKPIYTTIPQDSPVKPTISMLDKISTMRSPTVPPTNPKLYIGFHIEKTNLFLKLKEYPLFSQVPARAASR